MKNSPSKKTKVIVILGPTSSGKSNVAIKLAKKINGEVISVDSRQIYRHMNLGTGKIEGEWKKSKIEIEPRRDGKSSAWHAQKNAIPSPTKTFQKNHTNDGMVKTFVSEGVPHYLIDFVDSKNQGTKDDYNISHFQKDCLFLIEKISRQGKTLILCGGTGFWISSVVDGTILPEVKPNLPLRKKLEKKSAEELFAKLEKLDPERAKTIDTQNKVRLIRAIEICEELGKVPKVEKIDNSNFEFLQVGFDWPKEKLQEKIKKRLETRFLDGMISEVKDLKEKHKLSFKKIQSFGLAYFWVPKFLEEEISEDELKEKVFFAENGYAKRQRTWFARDKRIVWKRDYEEIKKEVKRFLEE